MHFAVNVYRVHAEFSFKQFGAPTFFALRIELANRVELTYTNIRVNYTYRLYIKGYMAVWSEHAFKLTY